MAARGRINNQILRVEGLIDHEDTNCGNLKNVIQVLYYFKSCNF